LHFILKYFSKSRVHVPVFATQVNTMKKNLNR